jgi:hypothetical protein
MLVVSQILVALAAAYLVTGACVAAAFVLFRLDAREEMARSSHAFRVLLFPGLALLWPAVLSRWAATPAPARPPRPAEVHRRASIALAIALLLVIAAAWSLRPSGDAAPPAVRIGGMDRPAA